MLSELLSYTAITAESFIVFKQNPDYESFNKQYFIPSSIGQRPVIVIKNPLYPNIKSKWIRMAIKNNDYNYIKLNTNLNPSEVISKLNVNTNIETI